MSAETPSHPNHKLHKKLMRRRALRESWPLLVWFGVAALGVWAYKTGGEFNRMRGIVSKPVETVGAPFTGTLVALPEGAEAMELEQGVFVEGGSVVAMMDDGLLQAEIAAEKQKAVLDNVKQKTEMQQQIIDLNAQIHLLKGDEAEAEAAIRAQDDLLVSRKKEVAAGLRTESEVQEVETAIKTLTAALTSTRLRIVSMENLIEETLKNMEALETEMNRPEAENDILNLLKAKVARSTVKTTSSGYIDKIYARPGSVVKEGDPIMDIVVKEAKTITAMIPEEYSLTMKQGDTAYIAIPNNRKEYVTATVVSLQQSLMQIPDFGSPIRGRMVRGRLVEFGNLGGNGEDSQLPLLPGSEVVVSLKPPGRIPFLSWFEG